LKTTYKQNQVLLTHKANAHFWHRYSTMDMFYVAYGLLIVIAVLVSYLLGVLDWLPSFPEEMDLENMMAPPGTEGYPLGTDFMGRDILSRLIVGIQAYFLPGLFAISIALTLGTLFGVLSGYFKGYAGYFVSYLHNILDSMPRLVLILLVVAAFKPDIYLVMLVLGITCAPLVASLIKDKIILLQKRNFVESSVALGLPVTTIIFKHILWCNCRAIIIIQATLIMAEAIMLEASLSYLGFGVQEPTPSWGNMVQAGANYLMNGDIWPSTAPALAILFTVLGFHLLGDGLNNILEGKRR